MRVYLNGRFVDHSEATVSVDDRGFLFADGVYEVIRVYDGRLFLEEPHMRRMRDGLRALQISDRGIDGVGDIARQLIERNGVTGDGTVYVQITRGAAPRKHAFPAADTATTVYMFARPFKQHPDAYFTDGVAAITTSDTRWGRCDIKSISLLPNVLANQEAHAADAFEALSVRDGVLIEGSHSNLFGVVDGILTTYPSSNYILTGITRNLVLELAHEIGLPVAEAPIYWDHGRRAHIEELFLSGTTTEVMPVTRLDGQPVGSGRPVPITRQLQQAFRERIQKMTSQATAA
ncbi:aminotransferase class IV [soil metagenome]